MRIKKKGTTGNAKNYITRTQAVRKLQVSLQDFRRLCIFKGIYPREPRNKKKASKSSTPSTTFYYTRDIQYLLHEPLLNKFREHKALAKKIGRALGRGQPKDAERLDKSRTRMTLDHIVKERYPTFVDALRDLDDALSMLFLFASLPSTSHVPPKTIVLCKRLCLEFQHYVITSHSLRRSFLSIKGIYYQATIMGQDIMWLVPYNFVQNTAGDIDFRIMGTFVEFYTTLVGFVNYRLYTSIGLVYPPKFNVENDEQGGELGAYKLEGRAVNGDSLALPESTTDGAVQPVSHHAQSVADQLADQQTDDQEETSAGAAPPAEAEEEARLDAIDSFEVAALDDADTLVQPAAGADTVATLFSSMTVFLGRETPRAPLEFLLKAFGCKRVGWDTVLGVGAFTNDEKDPRITHQIVDRPHIPGMQVETDGTESSNQSRVTGRTYVQPQWVWDSANQGKLQRPDLYAPGVTLPPHLSPWVKAKKGEYDPTLSLAEQEDEGEAEIEAAEEDEDEDEDEEDDEEDAEEEVDEAGIVKAIKSNGIADGLLDNDREVFPGEGMDIADDDDDDSDDSSPSQAAADDFGGFSDEDKAADLSDASEAEDDSLSRQRELEAEARGQSYNTSQAGRTPAKKSGADLKKKLDKKRKEEEEDVERRKMMLPNRKRKLFEKMQYSNRARDDAAKKLREKRRRIEKAA